MAVLLSHHPSMPQGITVSYRGGVGQDEEGTGVILERPKWQQAEDAETGASCSFFRAVI